MVGSKYLDNKWKKLNHQEHLRRIKDIKSEVALLQTRPYAVNPKLRGQKKEAENESMLYLMIISIKIGRF